jgi:tetratricopeptide (TPR) repeat protein/tRNA A-37 threonylcarbamoyl transferase component Bud32
MADSIAAFVEALETYRLLEPEQQGALTRDLLTRSSGLDAVTEELVRRDWLTPYQVDQTLAGRCGDLVLEPYLLLSPLGHGGMGQVFKARQRHMNRVVALKVIRHHSRSDPRSVQRFRREIQAVGRLDHRNVVRALHADEVNGTLFLVMEYVEGVTLADLVADVGPLAAAQASDYIRQVCLGLQHAHDQGLVHRDIKPSNLLLATKDAVVKILDLGLARLGPLVQGDATGSELTQIGSALGTMDYIAPEQALDPGRADTRSDIYSLGCTFYHLLAGQPPFPQGNWLQKGCLHNECEPRAIEALRPDLPPGLAQVVRTLMAKRPDDRYQGPAAVAAALEPFCRGIGAQVPEYRGSSASTILPPLLPAEPIGAERTGPNGDRAPADEPASAAASIKRARSHFNHGRYVRAIADFAEAIRLEPDNAQAYYMRGYAYGKMGLPDRAIADLDAALRLDPNLAWAHCRRGNAYHARGEYDRAIADFDAALRLDPGHAQAYNNRGYAHATKGDYERAIADYTEAIRLHPGHARAYCNRGFAFHARGQHRRAIADYSEVIRLEPNNSRAYNNRGNAYRARGKLDRAIADFDAALRLDPNNAGAYLNRGITYLARGENPRAIADFDAALGLDPSLVRAYYDRGNAYRAEGDYRRAIADYSQAIRLDPKDARTFNNRGFAHALRRDDDRAIADYSAAIQLDPGFARAYKNRADIYARKGLWEQADADRQTALRLGRGAPSIERM